MINNNIGNTINNNLSNNNLSTKKISLSIGILTKNEAKHIENCLRSAAFADQIVILDSGSTDKTLELIENIKTALNHPKIETHIDADWQGFGVQRNRLLSHLNGDFVFFLDADEVITPDLAQEIKKAVQSNENAVWKIEWRVVAFGQTLKHLIPQSQLERLFKRSLLKGFEGAVHEHPVLQITTKIPSKSDESLDVSMIPRYVFKSKLLHYSRETVRGSLEKLTQYALLGAAKRAEKGKKGGVLRGLASALAIFFRLYILRLGFTGGGAGFLFCFFIALECFFRYAALHYDQDCLSTDVTR